MPSVKDFSMSVDGVANFEMDNGSNYSVDTSRAVTIQEDGVLYSPSTNQTIVVSKQLAWSALPDPSEYIGHVFVTDVGAHGTYFYSNGVNWGIVGGTSIIERSAVALAAHTGTTALTTILTRTLPANLPGLNGAYRIKGKVTTTNNANLKTLFAYIGGSAATGIGYVSQAGGGFDIMIENRNSATSQIGSNGSASGMGGGAWTTGLAINTANPHDISLRCTLANSADSLILEAWQLELYRP